MPQIAQQDYLVITIADADAATADEKAVIREKIERGIIFDCLVVLAGTNISRVFAYDTNLLEIAVCYEGELTTISYSE